MIQVRTERALIVFRCCAAIGRLEAIMGILGDLIGAFLINDSESSDGYGDDSTCGDDGAFGLSSYELEEIAESINSDSSIEICNSKLVRFKCPSHSEKSYRVFTIEEDSFGDLSYNSIVDYDNEYYSPGRQFMDAVYSYR